MLNQQNTHIKTHTAEAFLRLRYLISSLLITFTVCYFKSTQIIYIILGPSLAIGLAPVKNHTTGHIAGTVPLTDTIICKFEEWFPFFLKDKVSCAEFSKNTITQSFTALPMDRENTEHSLMSVNFLDSNFIYTNVTEAFYATLEASICFTVLAILPLCSYQIWCFLMPSRYHRERRQVLQNLVSGVIYTVTSLAAISLWLVPLICQFLHHFSVETGKLQILNQLRIGPYLSWILTTEITLFLATLSPICVYLGLKSQWLTPNFVVRNRRNTIYCLLLAAAFLSPPDFSSQLTITFCLFIFFESAVWFYLYKISANKLHIN